MTCTGSAAAAVSKSTRISRYFADFWGDGGILALRVPQKVHLLYILGKMFSVEKITFNRLLKKMYRRLGSNGRIGKNSEFTVGRLHRRRRHQCDQWQF